MTRLRVAVLAIASAAGCGGTDPPIDPVVDAPPTDDAAPDDAAVDGAIGLVTITVLSELGDGVPDPDAIAIFDDPTGANIQHGLVDSSGVASAIVPEGSSVTVLRVRVSGPYRDASLVTFRGVEPGDHLYLGKPLDPTRELGTETYMTATYSPPPGTSFGQLFKACGGGAPNGTQGELGVSFRDYCNGSTFDLLAYVFAGTTRHFVWQTDVPYVDGGTFALATNWAPMQDAALTVLNVPDNPGFAWLTAARTTMIETRPIVLGMDQVELPGPGTHAMTLLHAPGAGNGTRLHVGVGGGLGSEGIVRYTDDSPATHTVDFDTLPVPRMTSDMQTQSGASWVQTGSGGDVRIVIWTATMTTADHRVFWETVEDPTLPAMTTLPILPAAYAQDDPSTVHPLVIGLTGVSAAYLEYDNVDGYDAARPLGPRLRDIEAMFLGMPHEVHASFSP
jgi:hypothetical protein